MVESGRITRSAPECEMSRSCHRATFSTAAEAFPRSTRASPVMRSVTIGLRLWGMALEPFWPARKGSSTSRTSVRCRWRTSVATPPLPPLGALQVAPLCGEPLEPAAGERDRLHELRVPVARHDLGGDGLGGE